MNASSFVVKYCRMRTTYGAIILAGGKSERMNFPKPYLRIDGKTFLNKIAEVYYNAGITDICLVINEEFCGVKWESDFEAIKPFVKIIEKTDSKFGRFHSIKLGVKKFLNKDFVFIQNADNPFIDKEIIEKLKNNRFSLGYTQPFHKGQKGHPVLISKKVSQKIDSILDDDYNLRTVLEEFPKTDVAMVDKGILANLNTREDYEKFAPVVK